MMTTAEKLTALRRAMAQRGLAAYLVPTDDFHASEYVGDYFKAREYLSGFTGSAGTLLILPSRALLWTDGRYFLQAESQLAGSGIRRAGRPDTRALPARGAGGREPARFRCPHGQHRACAAARE